MSTLQDFLNTHIIDDITAEVIVSERFKDKDGKLLPFTIKAMNNDSYEEARRKATKYNKNGINEFNATVFNSSIVIENTIDPCFKVTKNVDSINAGTPYNYLKRVLLPGEITVLATKILDLSGFNENFEELVEEAKN